MAQVWLGRHGRAALAFAVAVIGFLGALFPLVGFVGLVAIALAIFGTSPRRPLSIATVVLGAASAIAACLLLVLPRAGAARGSSPHVYSYDGSQHRLDADVVSGALYSWAERRDVARLSSLRATGGEYRLRVQNDLEGTTDHVDSVGVMIVDHEPDTEILATPDGRLVAVQEASAPSRAVDGAGADVLEALSAEDGRMVTGATATESGEPRQTWTLEFPSPDAARAILVLRARSTTFAEDAFFRYMATMGQGIGPFMERVVKADCGSVCATEVMAEELARLGLPLRIENGTQLLYEVAPVGPALVKSFALPIELPPGGETITLKLTATPLFWDLDQAVLAREVPGAIVSQSLEPRSAVLVSDAEPEDVLDRVSAVDGRRTSVHARARIDLTFDAPREVAGLERSAFVAIRGYYQVPIGGAPLVNPVTVLAHRWGLTSLPRFAATSANP